MIAKKLDLIEKERYQGERALMNTKLEINHPLFNVLARNPPLWWENLKNDPEFYIEVRKDNSINVYYNGASLMKLSYINKKSEFRAKISPKYIPLDTVEKEISFVFHYGNIILPTLKSIEINNFEENAIKAFKERIKLVNPTNKSEKGIQGKYITKSHASEKENGFFVDSEFASSRDNSRIDMVWVDLQEKKIAFVELKTIDDYRLYSNKKQVNETIDEQLKKYWVFTSKEKRDLEKYFSKVVQIKRRLGILPACFGGTSLEDFELIEKPILLIGNCTTPWIKENAKRINDSIEEIAFGSVYRGVGTNTFEIPYQTNLRRNMYRLSSD